MLKTSSVFLSTKWACSKRCPLGPPLSGQVYFVARSQCLQPSLRLQLLMGTVAEGAVAESAVAESAVAEGAVADGNGCSLSQSRK